MVVLTSLAIIMASVFMTRHIYQREITEARRELLSFDRLLANQTSRSIQSVELVQDNVVDELRNAGLNDPGDLERLAGGHDMHERLRQRISGMPQLDAVTLIASDGQLVNFSRYWPIPEVNISDRDYFKVLSRSGAPSTGWGQPVRNRGTGTWTIYLARRLTGQDGQFLGLVLGAMETSYFEDLYRKLDLPPGFSIAMWRADGLLLAHFPNTSDVGRLFNLPFAFRTLQPGQHKISISSTTLAGDQRLVASERLHDQPIVVSVTRSVSSTLSDWRLDTEVILVATALCVMAVMAMGHLVMRQFRTYETAAAAMSAREAAERGLHEAEALLLQGQKMEAMGRLTAGVAHDFNNLLTIVRANAELLGNAITEAKMARRLNTICQAADRGATLTRQMLAFSRQQILTPGSVEVNSRLRSISELLATSLGTRLRFAMQLAPDLWPAYVDAAQLEQAILNLIINARDASPDGGRVTIKTENTVVSDTMRSTQLAPGDYIRVTVSDDGQGMTPETRSRAFDPFFTTKEQGRGTGLGLSQVVGFARQSNGDVMLESTYGIGTKAHILLPRAKEMPKESVSSSAAGQAPVSTTDTLSVLVVDDNRPVREATTALLRQHGFHVTEAADGKAALALLESSIPIDMVLTDYAMPDSSGLELAQQLRSRSFAQPIVFITGYGDPELLQSERWVIRKPFDAADLANLLRQAWAAPRPRGLDDRPVSDLGEPK